MRGWRKNIYAGGRNAALGGAVGRALYPAILLAMPLAALAPPIALVLAARRRTLGRVAHVVGGRRGLSRSCSGWRSTDSWESRSAYALTYPLGLAMLLYIAAGAVARGSRVEWKDRDYVSR